VTLEVLRAGVLSTVQDRGRPDLGALGIAPGGAADPWSMAVANRLLGNGPDAAVLEMTLAGPALRAERPMVVAIAGADLGAVLAAGGQPVRPGSTVLLAAGDVLDFPGPAARGARAYLAVPGGIDVPIVLGSRSTALGAGFGGVEGRALRTGDRLVACGAQGERASSAMADHHARTARWPGPLHAAGADPNLPDPLAVRVLPGPHVTPGSEPLAALRDGHWTVSVTGDRTGLRLAGGLLPGDFTGELASLGVTWGAVQVPPDGAPIVLLTDHQPTGGYPVLAVVIVADRPRLAQLRPGDPLRFVPSNPRAAVDALRIQRAIFAEMDRRLHDDARWEELWRSAGG
jgi:5-oxoprolinase (ATP-hydrolysing) subunit C